MHIITHYIPAVIHILGFAQSEPVNVAGVTTRSTAGLIANKRIDLSLYSKDEIALLTTIDDELDRRTPAAPIATPGAIATATTTTTAVAKK